jgi:hypothetical protein
VPAPHDSPTSSTVLAPLSMALRISESVVTWQRQTNMRLQELILEVKSNPVKAELKRTFENRQTARLRTG